MALWDPKERLKRVTQTDFVLNKRELQSESKTACAVVRLDGIEREWIRILILEVPLYASVCGDRHVWTVYLCVISKVEEWEGLPCDTGHLCHSCFIYDMITNTHTQMHGHTPTYNKEPGFCFVCMSVAWFSQKPGWVAWHRHSIPGSPQAALGQEAHHYS